MRRVPSLCLGREGWGWKKSKQSELTLSLCLSPLLAMVALPLLQPCGWMMLPAWVLSRDSGKLLLASQAGQHPSGWLGGC